MLDNSSLHLNRPVALGVSPPAWYHLQRRFDFWQLNDQTPGTGNTSFGAELRKIAADGTWTGISAGWINLGYRQWLGGANQADSSQLLQ